MTEQDLLDQMAEADQDLKEAQLAMARARESLVAAESNIIRLKLLRERAEETLRLFRLQQVVLGEDYALYDE